MSDDTPYPNDLSIPSSVDDGGAVPIEELEALMEQWRSYASQYGSNQRDTFNARCETYDTCADELQAAIDDYE